MTAPWRYSGNGRPAFATTPRSGQESVWDYPRPPVCRFDHRQIEVYAGDARIARTRRAIRVLETASPPTFYIPRDDVLAGCLRASPGGHSMCEWNGLARYFDVVTDGCTIGHAAWCYDDPGPSFDAIRGWLAFYPDRCACRVDGEPVRAQRGGFYAGWITGEIVGPFKGEPGTSAW